MKDTTNKTKTIYLLGNKINLIEFLHKEGFNVYNSIDINDMFSLLMQKNVDLIIIDISYLENEKISITDIKSKYQYPLIIISDYYDETLNIYALNSGADEFCCLNMKSTLFLAKINTLLRLVENSKNRQNQCLLFENLKIDIRKREVILNQKSINFTPTEFDMFTYLARNAGKIITRDEMHKNFYNFEYNGLRRAIDINISRIRKKIGDNQSMPRYLKTVHGTGYLFIGHK